MDRMQISRHDVGPGMTQIVVHHDTIFLCGRTAEEADWAAAQISAHTRETGRRSLSPGPPVCAEGDTLMKRRRPVGRKQHRAAVDRTLGHHSDCLTLDR